LLLQGCRSARSRAGNECSRLAGPDECAPARRPVCSEILFFDDSTRNIAAAHGVGMGTVLIGTSTPCSGADLALTDMHQLPQALPQLLDQVGVDLCASIRLLRCTPRSDSRERGLRPGSSAVVTRAHSPSSRAAAWSGARSAASWYPGRNSGGA
jgi:hypothetical protein